MQAKEATEQAKPPELGVMVSRMGAKQMPECVRGPCPSWRDGVVMNKLAELLSKVCPRRSQTLGI